MKAIAPGKIIISGEHSVVYGKPALVMAVNRFAEASIVSSPTQTISFDLLDFNQRSSFTICALHELKRRLVKNYHLFLNGELRIRDVLAKPFELFDFLFITLLDGLHLKLDRGVNIRLKSNIPIGCGMGSSAATILSVLRAVVEFFSLDFKPEKFYQYGLEAEKLQHGNPSGVDPYISLHGGFVRFQQKTAEKRPMPNVPMFLVNTGTPLTTTGECVEQVAKKFSESKIWDDFAALTEEVEEVLACADHSSLRRLIRENNRLLSYIGVVPDRVQNFILDIEKLGGVAKVSGAGAVLGHNAGMVLILADESPAEICQKYSYQLMPVEGEPLGARIV
jgi:mevalonate kinase